MNEHATDHGHAEHGHAPTKLPFSEKDITGFQASDRQAASALVYLMTGVFSTGLFLYIFVCLTIVWQW